MKKFIAAIFILVFIISLSISASAQPRGDVLFIYGYYEETSIGPGDLAVKARFEKLGFTVTMVAGPDCTTEMGTGKALIYAGESITSTDVADKYKDITVSAIMGEPGVFDDMLYGNFTQTDGSEGIFTVAAPDNEVVKAAGVTGDFDPFTEIASPGFLTEYTVDAQILVQDDLAQAAIGLYETGAKMLNDFIAPARRATFYIRGQDAVSATEDTWKLFDAVVNWSSPAPIIVEPEISEAENPKTSDVSVIFYALTALSSISILSATYIRSKRK